MTDGEPTPRVAPPYSTGGGGTVLEHRYAATVLGCLLTGDPVAGLGDDATPMLVRFQAGAISAVDDLVVEGRTADGGSRRLSIGVRRAPTFVPSEESSVPLFASYLRVVTNWWQEVAAGRWRLALVVASPNPAATQLARLCEIAQATDNDQAFRTKVSQPGQTSQPVRSRLQQIDALVQAAATHAQLDTRVVAAEELTWRLLSALRLLVVRLEGTDESDRTDAIRRLRPATRAATAEAADQLFARLGELVDRYAPAGAEVTVRLLRRDLSGFPLCRSRAHGQAWEMLDRLAERLHDRTGFRLTDGQVNLELDRTETRAALTTAMRTISTGPGVLIVHGEPDVGKSALTLRAAQDLTAAGAAVTAVSLPDLPADVLDLETRLGDQLVAVLAATATDGTRLLIIDGAEFVLEGRRVLLTELAIAAIRAGLGVIAVTRGDAANAVTEAMRNAVVAAGSGEVREHHVPRLNDSETQQVSTNFAVLDRIGQDPRASWLLGRPGLVDLLLRARVAGHLPDGPLAEADLFAVIWARLVRRGEEHPPGGPPPEARDRALTGLARRFLLPGDQHPLTDPVALPSLRSDGLLLAPGPTSAWQSGDQFGSDLVRDLAVARLLIVDGWPQLSHAGAPRQALRAARVACQTALAAAGEHTEPERVRLQAMFDDLASRHGARWSEVPLEAMLTLGNAEAILRRAWPDLLAEHRAGLRTLLRLAVQRYSDHGWGDPTVLAPLVTLTFCTESNLGQHDRYDRDTGEQVRDLVLAWLRGLIQAGTGPLPLRQQVRDRLLASSPEDYDEFAVEALATLGPDLDHHATAFLTRLADEGGGHLAPAVESVGAVIAMTTHQPDLLIMLAEAFYIQRSTNEDGSAGFDFDGGIRQHQKAGRGSMVMAGWYYGPFYRLLHARPKAALALIHQMLDHAVARQVDRDPAPPPDPGAPESVLPGLDLDLPGVGVRRCVGDEQVWSWYHGSPGAPPACVSALLAVERFADELVDTVGVSLSQVSELLLSNCHNLAMPALVVGLLVRHLNQAGDLIDRWLVCPELWQLEIARAVGGQLHIQGADPPDLVGRHRRTATFQDVVAELVVQAMLVGDHGRLAVLAAKGDELLERAGELVAGRDDEADTLLMLSGWASMFRAENHRLSETGDGHLRHEWMAPEPIFTGLAPTHEEFARGDAALRLQLTYARSEDRVADIATLTEDLVLARDLAQNPAIRGPANPADPVAAVAAAAIIAHAQGRAHLSDHDIEWAADILIDAATRPRMDALRHMASWDSSGADRSAAMAVPALLLPAFDGIALNRAAIAEALQHSATSRADEVRVAFALGLQPVWAAPCAANLLVETCRHQIAWAAAQAGLRDCRLGAWDPSTQERLTDPLEAPFEESLPTVATECLLVNRLTAPIVAAAAAARSNACIAPQAAGLRDVLFEAHRRGTDHWATEGYDHPHNRHRDRVVRVLIESAIVGDAAPLTTYVRAFTANARALDQLLHDLRELFTYDDALRPSSLPVWRQVMTTALDALQAGANLHGRHHWRDGALAGLLPTPQITHRDDNPAGTLERVRPHWLDPDTIADLVTRWMPFTLREPKAVDAVVDLAHCATLAWQATTALTWVETLIDGDYAAIAGRCWGLTDWLETVQTSGHLDPNGEKRWQRLVDGLAAHGDHRAVPLQQTQE